MSATFINDNAVAKQTEAAMTDRDYNAKLEELDRLLNDPEVAMEPSRVWSLLAEVSAKESVE